MHGASKRLLATRRSSDPLRSDRPFRARGRAPRERGLLPVPARASGRDRVHARENAPSLPLSKTGTVGPDEGRRDEDLHAPIFNVAKLHLGLVFQLRVPLSV